MHFGIPPTRYGILLIRVSCHQEQQDIACTFKWLESNKGKRIDAFAPVTHDYGLRDLVELDGFNLPTSIQQCQYQLEDKQYDWPLRFVDQRFVRAMDRELERNSSKGDWRKWNPTLPDMIQELSHHNFKLQASLSRSANEAVATAEITERTADLSNICMKIFEMCGTPSKRPDKFIDEALPNSNTGTKWDTSLMDSKIDIKPQDFQNHFIGMPAPIPRIGEEWECEYPINSGKWTRCLIINKRDDPRGWQEYLIRYVDQTEEFQERWWKHNLRPKAQSETTPQIAGLNPIDFDYIGRKVKAEIKNTGNLDTRAEITASTTLISLGLEKEDRLEIIFGLESQQIAQWPVNYDGHDWITVGDIIESANKHQPVTV